MINTCNVEKIFYFFQYINEKLFLKILFFVEFYITCGEKLFIIYKNCKIIIKLMVLSIAIVIAITLFNRKENPRM